MSKREIIEAELREIWDARGRLLPNEVVEVAADPEHPLHGFFDWDDTAAAAKFRKMQAASLIRSVKVRVETSDATGQVSDYKVRAWVAPRASGAESSVPAGYVPSDQVPLMPEVRDALLRQMRRDWSAFKRRYEHHEEFWTLVHSAADENEAVAG